MLEMLKMLVQKSNIFSTFGSNQDDHVIMDLHFPPLILLQITLFSPQLDPCPLLKDFGLGGDRSPPCQNLYAHGRDQC